MEPDHGMVKFGGRFARTTRALTGIWLGDGHGAAAAPGIQRLCSPRGSTFHDLSVGENGGERTGLRPRGGRDQGSHRAGADMDRRNGFQTSPSHWLRVAGVLIAVMIVGAGWTQTEARSPRKDPPKRPIHGPNYHPPYAAIVIDDKSGFVLHEVSADEPRHPASLTKIMTLYLLFEQLEAGKLSLDTELPISTWAALQNPTKLGLKANQTIKVEDAIKGLVTKSANDAAVVVAEAIGGSEAEFAKLMTLKARMLGMTSTTYVNASGLPAEEQITTARDQAVLGRAIQHRFPVYYQYFATP